MELYHVLNRGVDTRTIFQDQKDFARFVHNLWEFNDVKNTINVGYRARTDIALGNQRGIKDRIVDIHAWCLMKNHYHLLLSERSDGALTKFIRRLNVGYANYFNERYKRKGALFQGRTKKLLISNDAHFLHILNYIHCNPLDFLDSAKNWRLGTVGNAAHTLSHLSKYRWSSYLDYVGTTNFPSLLTKDLFIDVFKDYQKEISAFLKEREVRHIAQYRLED